MDFKNKVVLITGAGSGIGRTMSSHFAKSCAVLSLTDIDEKNLLQTTEDCKNITKTKVISNVVDLVHDEEVRNLIDTTKSACGKIDVLINCAGIFQVSSVMDPNIMNVFDHVIVTNLRSIVVIINFATPALIESKGCIINISSISAVANSTMLPYSVEKAILGQLTKFVALELVSKGVRLNSILAGPVKTNMLLNTGMPLSVSDAFFDTAAKVSPLKKALTTEDIANLTLYLASDKSASITGTDFILDCGMLLTGIQETVKPLCLESTPSVNTVK